MKKFTRLFSLIVGINSFVLFNSANAMYSTRIPIFFGRNSGYVDPVAESIIDFVLSKLKEKIEDKKGYFYLALKSELGLNEKPIPCKHSFKHLWMVINSNLNTWSMAYAGIYINPISDDKHYNHKVIGVKFPGSNYERISRNIKSDKIIYEIECGKLYRYHFSIEISIKGTNRLKIVLSGEPIDKSEEINFESKQAFDWFTKLCNSFKNKK